MPRGSRGGHVSARTFAHVHKFGQSAVNKPIAILLADIEIDLGKERFNRYPVPMRYLLLPLLTLIFGMFTPAFAVAPGEGFDVERYSVAIRPNLQTSTISGSETIVLRSTLNHLSQISFSPNALRIRNATVNGVSVAVKSHEEAITFTLPRSMKNGDRVTLRFHYEGLPKRGVTVVKGGLYTSYYACDWLVCLQDSPGDKAHLALDLLLPHEVQSIGIGRAKAIALAADGLTLHRWRSTRPVSSYLFAFAAGQFTQHSDLTEQGHLLYFNMTGVDADLSALIGQSREMVAFFADKAGMPLPDRRYTQMLVPGTEAQESASFSLIGKGYIDAEASEPAAAWVIAHELAHQWWGNLVTCSSWQDFWLNEGITTFMTAAWKQHKFGETAYLNELDNARRRVARVRDQGFDKPLAWSGKYPSLGVRRAVQYSKGGLFLAHLREALGEKAFWNGLRQFTRQHAGGTVTSKDFQRAMERESESDLSQTFNEWVYENPQDK